MGQFTGANYEQPFVTNLNPGHGHKRTHNQAFNNHAATTGQTKPESKPKVPAAPGVPSFGFALPTTATPPGTNAVTTETAATKKKPRKNNSLGLTPKGGLHEESDNDIDEEAAYAQSGSSTVQFRGRSIQLNTAADVAAWIAERKKRFPTAARIEARKATIDAAKEEARVARDAEKKRRLEERDKALHAKRQAKEQKKTQRDPKPEGETVKPEPEVRAEPAPDDPLARIAQLEEQLRLAREALAGGSKPQEEPTIKVEPQEPMPEIKKEPDTVPTEQLPMLEATTFKTEDIPQTIGGLGLDYDSVDEDDDHDSISDISSEDPSSESSDSDEDASSDSDAQPEEESSKSQNPLRVAAPPREGRNKSQMCYAFANTGKCKYGDRCHRSHDVPCRFYAKNGHCRYGDKCRMSHDVTPGTGKKAASNAVERKKPMSLRERMIEQELEEEARVGLGLIKQLGASGFFDV